MESQRATKIILSRKLRKIEKIINIKKILARDADNPKNIAKYYKKNRLAYSLFNSHNGFVHMGISDNDSFTDADFYKQAKIVSEQIGEVKAKNVLELAPGKLATLNYLAKEKSNVDFYGIDLPNGQFVAKSHIPNIKLTYGDYHDLSNYSNESMDIVYVIEALCHAHNKDKVIAEVFRVLKKDGRFIVIDGYFSKVREGLSNDEKIAIQLVTKSMMVTDRQQQYDMFCSLIEKNNLKILNSIDFSQNILPSLRRLEYTAFRFMKHPILANIITSLAGDIVTANSVAGYLMPTCVEDGLFEYRYTLCQKS